jgi:hypothetical protein
MPHQGCERGTLSSLKSWEYAKPRHYKRRTMQNQDTRRYALTMGVHGNWRRSCAQIFLRRFIFHAAVLRAAVKMYCRVKGTRSCNGQVTTGSSHVRRT